MAYLSRQNWLWMLLAFLIGAIITWFLLNRRQPSPVEEAVEQQEEVVEEKALVTVGAPQRSEEAAAPAPAAPAAPEPEPEQLPFSVRMEQDQASDELQAKPEAVPAGKYGEGSADAVPHQGPPDGFTIKGNAQSMLFHTPDSPYYGRTKAEVWFRAEADAERAGFTKYVRKPRKSTRPAD